MNNRLDQLTEQYFAQTITPEELAELNATLAADPAALDYFVDQVDLHTALNEEAHLGVAEDLPAVASGTARSKRPSPNRLHRVARRQRGGSAGRIFAVVGLAAAALAMFAYLQGWFGGWPAGRGQPMVEGAGAAARTARVEWVRGGAQSSAADGAARALVGGETVRPGTTLETMPGAELLLRYADGTAVTVRGGSRVRLATAGAGKIFQVERGAVAGAAAPQPAGAPMVLEGAFGRATVVGTRFLFSSVDGSTDLTVFEGAVEFERLSDGAKLVVKGGGQGQMAKAGPGLDFRVETPAQPQGDIPPLPVPAKAGRLVDDFSAPEQSGQLWSYLNPNDQSRILVADGVLQLHAANTEDAWLDWYAVARQPMAMESVTIQLRMRIPAQASNLVSCVSLLRGEDSGRGDLENLELLFRSREVELRRVQYPKGSKNGPHPETTLASSKTSLWNAAEWIAVTLELDATQIRAIVNGRELFNGPHGLADWKELRLGVYAGLKNSPQEYVVEFDSIAVNRPDAPGGAAGSVPGGETPAGADGQKN